MSKITEISIDAGAVSSCRQLLVDLFNAYTKLVAGQARVRVRYGDRWTEYEPGKGTQLLALYNTIYAQCPDTAGLIDLDPGRRVKRGPPARLRIY